MFGKLFSHITSGFTSLVSKFALRASVAIPFLLAFGFGLAGLEVALSNAFGQRNAYLLMAAGFVVIGLLAAAGVWLKERNEKEDTGRGPDPATIKAVATSAVETGKRIPSAIAVGASDATTGKSSIAQFVAGNWPVLLVTSIAVLVLGRPPEGYTRNFRARWPDRPGNGY